MAEEKKPQQPVHPRPTPQQPGPRPINEEKANHNQGGRTSDWAQQERPDKKK